MEEKMKRTNLNIINATRQALCTKPGRLRFNIYTSSKSWNTENINNAVKMLFCDVGFEILTAMVIKSSVFLDVTPCSSLKSTDVSEEHVASIFMVEQ
jgi:hypothetical protein